MTGMPTESPPKIGIENIDADLESLFRCFESENWAADYARLIDPDLEQEDILAILSKEVLVVALHFISEAKFEQVKAHSSNPSAVETWRDLILSQMGEIRKNKTVQKLLLKLEDSNYEPLDEARNSPNHISGASTWQFQGKYLKPGVQVVFADHILNKLLFTFYADWNDLGFMIERLSDDLAVDVIRANESLSSETITKELGQKEIERLNRSIKNIQKILGIYEEVTSSRDAAGNSADV